jgi:2-polyprenyl-3-methyl-5-hydroxy-6-metoxy-1,4-benzoquinol methylase
MVSAEDVIAAYRFILGREPESAAAVQFHMAAPSLEQLRRDFLKSNEFRTAITEVAGSCFSALVDHAGPIKVDVDTDEETMTRLLSRVERCWTQLGQTEPHWSVLSTDQFRRANFERNADAFYASGEEDVKRLAAWLDRNRVDRSQFESCLELGCGTGRVTAWLARCFRRVLACDISPAHLEFAATHARESGVSNVNFVHTSKVCDLTALPAVDVVYSVIVLQHNPPPVIRRILESVLQLLNPGGVAFFQVPTYALQYSFSLERYLLEPEKQEFDMHLIPQRFVFELAAANNSAVLEVQPDEKVGTPGWISNTFLVQKRTY